MARRSIVLFLAVTCSFSSCSALKAGPSDDAGFIESPEHMVKDERFPFHGWWVKPGSTKGKSGKIFVPPVNTDYLKKTSSWSHITDLSKEEINAKAMELGTYFRERLITEFREKEGSQFQIVDSTAGSDGSLEIAIVELVPTEVARNATGTVLGLFVPGGGLVSAGASGTIAIEGRFRSSKTGEVVAEFKDRETAKIAPVDVSGFTRFRFAERIIEDWAEQIVEILETPSGATIADSSPFTLLPW